jgi:hypothetical protein
MQKYIRSGVVSISEVLPLIKKSNKRAIVGGEYVKVNSLRLRTFTKSTVCKCCGLEASYFAVERDTGQETYHLNLYGIRDGKEVLFTHDHTLARSLGGDDKIHNTTTMCNECNFKKSIIERDAIKRIRQNESKKEEIIHGMSLALGLSIRRDGSTLQAASSQTST